MKSGLVKRIMQIVAKRYDITVNDIVANRRTDSLVRARHVAMTVAVRATPLSLPQIGRCFNRDHTTILHARDKIEQQAQDDPSLARELDEIASIAIGKEMEFVRNNLGEIATHLAPLINAHIKIQIMKELQALHPLKHAFPPEPANDGGLNKAALAVQQSPKLPKVNDEIHAAISTMLVAHRQWQSGYFSRNELVDRQKMDQAVAELRTIHTNLFKGN